MNELKDEQSNIKAKKIHKNEGNIYAFFCEERFYHRHDCWYGQACNWDNQRLQVSSRTN